MSTSTRWARRWLAALVVGTVLVPLTPLAGGPRSDRGSARSAAAFMTVPQVGTGVAAAEASIPTPRHAGGTRPESCDDGGGSCSGEFPASPITCAPAPGCAAAAYLPAAPALVRDAPTEELVARRTSPVTPARIALDLPTPPPRV